MGSGLGLELELELEFEFELELGLGLGLGLGSRFIEITQDRPPAIALRVFVHGLRTRHRSKGICAWSAYPPSL